MASNFEGVLSLAKFQGINQGTDGHNLNLGYGVEAMNCDTLFGGLKPYHKPKKLHPGTGAVDTTIALDLEHGDGGRTLAFFTKRWQSNSGVIGLADSYENGYCVAVVDGKLYYRRKHLNSFATLTWTEILNPATNTSFAFSSSKFDAITYEINYLPPVKLDSTIIAAVYGGTATYYTFDLADYAYYQVQSDDGTSAYYTDRAGTTHALTSGSSNVRLSSDEAPVDCLLITNATDGMWCIYAPLETTDLAIAYVPVQPVGTAVETKFGSLALYAERVWGTGISTDPDKLMYSAPHDVFCWDQYNDVPDDGAGDIQQPDWDGDMFTAIKPFGHSLLAIKQRAIWRVTGTTPSEFVMRRQFGEGTIEEDTFAVRGSTAYMLTDDDVKAYDGSSTYHLKYGFVKKYLDDLNFDLTERAGGKRFFGRIVEDLYVLHICTHDYGFMLLVYNLTEGTVNMIMPAYVSAMEAYGKDLYGIFAESVYDAQGQVTGTYLQFAKLMGRDGEQYDVSWESAWQDLGAKHVAKSGFILYLMFDKMSASETVNTISPTVVMRTEKKTKSKTVTMPYNKVKRIRLNCNGRQFKLRIEVPAQAVEWQISTGLQLYVEYDPD